MYHPISEELEGQVLGIVGLGASGRELATRAAPLGLRVRAVDVVPPPEPPASYGVERFGGLDELDDLLAESDYVSLHVPLNASTRHLIDERRLALMKPTAALINVARGRLIDEDALVDALRDGRLRGAGIDVFGEEPLTPQNPLLQLDNVVATPHTAGVTRGTSRRRSAVCVENARADPGGPAAALPGDLLVSSDAPHILAEHRRSPVLDELFVVDLDVHVNDTPADLAPFCELPWRKSLEALEKVPQRYLDIPGFAPNFTPWAMLPTIERRTTVTSPAAAARGPRPARRERPGAVPRLDAAARPDQAAGLRRGAGPGLQPLARRDLARQRPRLRRRGAGGEPGSGGRGRRDPPLRRPQGVACVYLPTCCVDPLYGPAGTTRCSTPPRSAGCRSCCTR